MCSTDSLSVYWRVAALKLHAAVYVAELDSATHEVGLMIGEEHEAELESELARVLTIGEEHDTELDLELVCALTIDEEHDSELEGELELLVCTLEVDPREHTIGEECDSEFESVLTIDEDSVLMIDEERDLELDSELDSVRDDSGRTIGEGHD